MTTEWQRMFGAATRGKKSFPERAAAVRRAAEAYRHKQSGSQRRNPAYVGGGFGAWLIIGGAAFLGYKLFLEPKAESPYADFISDENQLNRTYNT